MKQNPKDIILACLRKERAAQHALFNLYNHVLFVSACVHLNDEQEAKEVVQETWIAVFKGLHSYDSSKSQITTWMKTILLRKIWKMKASERATVDLSTLTSLPAASSEVIDILSCEEILSEMEMIPTASRMVFKMYVLEGYKHDEIASMLHINESTSRAHLTKARRIMRQRYDIINRVTEK